MQPAITQLRFQLSPLYTPGEVTAIIRLLLEEVCGLTRTQQLAHPELHLSDEQHQRLADIGQRLATGEPVQLVLGYEWFAGHKFEVTRNTLIPRPETAELVDLILRDIHLSTPRTETAANTERLRLLDIGTGSGCIAISLALALPADIIALDLSEAALAVARHNATSLGADNVYFAQGDILAIADGVYSTSYQQLLITTFKQTSTIAERGSNKQSYPQYDVIVSNPPYICNREAADMERHVLDYEPHTALFVPDDAPLLFYRAIARFSQRALKPGGRLYFEINAAYGGDTCRLLTDMGYTNVCLHTDSFGRDRMISCTQANL